MSKQLLYGKGGSPMPLSWRWFVIFSYYHSLLWPWVTGRKNQFFFAFISISLLIWFSGCFHLFTLHNLINLHTAIRQIKPNLPIRLIRIQILEHTQNMEYTPILYVMVVNNVLRLEKSAWFPAFRKSLPAMLLPKDMVQLIGVICSLYHRIVPTVINSEPCHNIRIRLL